jgi:hypothetical protein
LEVVVAFVNFFLAFLVVRRPWVWRVLECSPELVALLSSVIALHVPRALLFQQVFEAAGGLLRVVFLKDRFGRPEEGSEWEPIKILPFG